jgi:hypothetical protein
VEHFYKNRQIKNYLLSCEVFCSTWNNEKKYFEKYSEEVDVDLRGGRRVNT